MSDYPQTLMPGDHITKTWIDQLLRALRRQRPLPGPGVRTKVTPNGTVLTAEVVQPKATKSETALQPFTVRFYKLDPDDNSATKEFLGRYGWKIYLPQGCVSVGETCTPINRRMNELAGHEDEDDNWYDLAVDEDADCGARTATEEIPDGEGGTTSKSVYYHEWEVIIHAKTQAKIYGVDELNVPARHLFYAEARPKKLPSGNARTDEEKAYNFWGDEFSQTVATFHVRSEPNTPVAKVSRSISAVARGAISVAGRAAQNFDLVWYFEVDEDTGKLSVTNVYCVRNSTAIGGMTVDGPTMTEVTDAQNSIWVMINTNTLITGNAAQNILEVKIDPQSPSSGDFVTWLRLYDIKYNVVSADYRASALNNAITFR